MAKIIKVRILNGKKDRKNDNKHFGIDKKKQQPNHKNAKRVDSHFIHSNGNKMIINRCQ